MKLPVFCVLLLPTMSFASDGVLEINQTCAVITGCFSGDEAGLPVTIDGSADRSYRLTSDLTVPDENTDGILVSTDDVGIDLNNFAILGPGTCSGVPLVCPLMGTGSGVEVSSQFNRGISVKNGSISGMGFYGVLLGDQGEAMNLRVRWNSFGIQTGLGSTVSGSTVYQNQRDGIRAASSSVSGNAVYLNGDAGILGFVGSTISSNTVRANEAEGISAGNGSVVAGNSVFNNGLEGIEGGTGCTVKDNTVHSNTGDGINGGEGSVVVGNSVFSSGGEGVEGGIGCGIKDNTIRSNTGGGILVGDACVISGNSISGSGGNGIDGGGGCSIKNNSVQGNTGDGILALGGSFIAGNSVTANGGNGIDVRQRSAVQSNTIRNNTGFGLDAGVKVGYRANVIGQNTAGPVTGSPNNLGENLCENPTPACP